MSKILKSFLDTGFGFPVYLLNVPMIEVRGHWTPDINYSALSKRLLRALAKKPARLTGNELRFIRNSFELTLKEFAEKFYVSHPAVIKWEKAENEPTNMQWATEKDIRMFVHLQVEGREDLVTIYKRLRPQASRRKRKTKIDVQEEVLVPA